MKKYNWITLLFPRSNPDVVQTPVMAPPIKPETVPEYLALSCRKLVLRYMMEFTDEYWDVHFITVDMTGECLNVHIWSSNPGQVIGVGGTRMQEMRSFIGKAINKPVYVNAKHPFDPFADPLPV